MGERKVLNKYYPPDFNPSSLSRRKKKAPDGPTPVRFMLPMSIRCTHCKSFMGRGLKFNARKYVASEKYLGLKIYRFSMKCIECGGEFWIRTNPKDATYETESGATKNYEPWKEKESTEEEEKKLTKDAEDLDVMEKMEKRVLDAKEEIEDLDLLEELKAKNAGSLKVRKEDLWKTVREKYDGRGKDRVEGEIEMESRMAFEQMRKNKIKRLALNEQEGGHLDTMSVNPLKLENDNVAQNGKRAFNEDSAMGLARQRLRTSQLKLKRRRKSALGKEKGMSRADETKSNNGLAVRTAQQAREGQARLSSLIDYESSSSCSSA